MLSPVRISLVKGIGKASTTPVWIRNSVETLTFLVSTGKRMLHETPISSPFLPVLELNTFYQKSALLINTGESVIELWIYFLIEFLHWYKTQVYTYIHAQPIFFQSLHRAQNRTVVSS